MSLFGYLEIVGRVQNLKKKKKTQIVQNSFDEFLTTRWQPWIYPSWTNQWWPLPSPWCWRRKTWCHFWWSTPGPGLLSLPASGRIQIYNTETHVHEKILHVNLPAPPSGITHFIQSSTCQTPFDNHKPICIHIISVQYIPVLKW